MSEKIYLHMLFFCGISCQGILATLSDKDNRLSSDLLVRKRRVINHLPGNRMLPRIERFNYIVKIKEGNRGICAGVILSHYTVITAAPCVRRDISIYKVLSGATSDKYFNFHDVTSKIVHYGNPPHREFDGIALITIDLPFEYTRRTGYIQLHMGPLPAGTQVTVTGWGYLYPTQPGTEVRQRLRTITLPIMNHRECQTAYRDRFNITEKHICTFDTEQYCARNDAGAPLVVNEKLAGIHVWKGEYQGYRNPDVFINLQRDDYSGWIREHSILL